jgi:hypothetical protein
MIRNLLPPENISAVMLDSFVDLKSSSVQLVFADGEQLQCHTFPLAARQLRENGFANT